MVARARFTSRELLDMLADNIGDSLARIMVEVRISRHHPAPDNRKNRRIYCFGERAERDRFRSFSPIPSHADFRRKISKAQRRIALAHEKKSKVKTAQ